MTQYEHEKLKLKDQRQEESTKKMQKIHEIIDNNQKIEETKKEALLRKQKDIEDRKKYKEK